MDTTLYPKITTRIKEVLHSLNDGTIGSSTSEAGQGPFQSKETKQLPLVGTVKLHGTHADILIYPNDDAIVLQSRNCLNISTQADNHGFAAAMKHKLNNLVRLRDRYYAHYKELNPDSQIDPNRALIIAGEWIGENIQKGVALVHLSKRLVIISANINGQWLPDEDYADIHDEEADIYNISRAGFYHAVLDPSNVSKTKQELEKLAENVAVSCPFTATFGIVGEGEGIVWKIKSYCDNPRMWFKTKGGKFKPTYTPTPRKGPSTDDILAEKRSMAVRSAGAWCSERRLEQGWGYLRERRLSQDIKNIGVFLKWITEDILAEEKWDIDQHEIDKKLLRAEITRIARSWYLK
ncbi:hypothetical protein AOQ84DRAFT_202894 [Glonium stellatum]|uniref:RNA ligase domain-containing protein n=1 Tax=Glonium stellatum TaxID=574774 RepID=A0A8E2F678_9PEZI|nr:hypothetical protein AOQ84DRAFT_202894 [Glonium stellatum]